MSKRRELVFHTRTKPHPSIIYEMDKCTHDIWMQDKDNWRFVELPDDAIVLTRENLHELWTKLFSLPWPENQKRLISCEILEREIFGKAE